MKNYYRMQVFACNELFLPTLHIRSSKPSETTANQSDITEDRTSRGRKHLLSPPKVLTSPADNKSLNWTIFLGAVGALGFGHLRGFSSLWLRRPMCANAPPSVLCKPNQIRQCNLTSVNPLNGSWGLLMCSLHQTPLFAFLNPPGRKSDLYP